jgi:CSLREA domain-containing protein
MRLFAALPLLGAILLASACGIFVGTERVQCLEEVDCPQGFQCLNQTCQATEGENGENGESDNKDAGTQNNDGGVNHDAGALLDAGPALDSGPAMDASESLDSGEVTDSAVPPPSDSGVPPSSDSGAPSDLDSGFIPDAGPIFDSGALIDSGQPVDSGSPPDGGSAPDAALDAGSGAGNDAGNQTDGGDGPRSITVVMTGYASVKPAIVALLSDGIFLDSNGFLENGSFTFDTLLADGEDYEVRVTFSPDFPTQSCVTTANLDPESGFIDGSDLVVEVQCTTTEYLISFDMQGDRTGQIEVSNGLGGTRNVGDGESGLLNMITVPSGSFHNLQVTAQPAPADEVCWSFHGRGLVRGVSVATPEIRCGPVIEVTTTTDWTDATPDNGLCDTGGQCSLRAAVQNASRYNIPVAIHVPAGTYQIESAGDMSAISEAGGDFDVWKGALNDPEIYLFGDGMGVTVLDADMRDRIFDVHAGTLRVEGVTLMNGGEVTNGGAVRVWGSNHLELYDVEITANVTKVGGLGGGIHGASSSTLLLSGVRLENNVAVSRGGLLNTHGDALIFDSLFKDGAAPVAAGANFGDQTNESTILMLNTTFMSNVASDSGAAFALRNGSVELFHTSIIDNNGTNGRAVDVTSGESITLANTVIANNTSSSNPPDCDSLGIITLTSWGHNFIGTGDGCAELLPPSDDFPNPGGTRDPRVELVSGNGVDEVWQPQVDSRILDNANGSICPPADQRGNARPTGAGCDVGAAER